MMVLYRCAVWGGGAKTRIAQMLSAVLPALTVKADILDRQPGARCRLHHVIRLLRRRDEVPMGMPPTRHRLALVLRGEVAQAHRPGKKARGA